MAGEHFSTSQRQSILFYTTQKCASVYISTLIERLAAGADMPHIHFDAYMTIMNVRGPDGPFGNPSIAKQAFVPQGYYYGPVGSLRLFPDVKDYATVLVLRDPRDVLTSLYFSTAYSHALITEKLIKERKEALGMSIDEYVLANKDLYQRIYSGYCDTILQQPNVLFLKYEDMVADFPDFLHKLAAHVGLDDQKEIIETLIAEANFKIDKEDPYSHRRQAKPGDHRNKLKAETIAVLNETFETILKSTPIQLAYT